MASGSHMRLFKTAGMVRETGEGSARLLHSMARGEAGLRVDTAAQAQRALTRVAASPRQPTAVCETAEVLVRFLLAYRLRYM